MKVFSSPQLGFNNNVRHKGRVFHIQTEDSGIKHPHVITHLFADGGRILKSTKTSYAEFVDDDELPKKVRALMQEQHKAMFIALRAGKFDSMLGDAPGDAATKAEEPPPPRPSQQSLVSASEFVREPVATLPGAAPPVATLPGAAAPSPPAPPAPPSAGAGARTITAAASPAALHRDRPPAEEKPAHAARPPADTAVDEVPPAPESQPISPKARLTPPPVRQTQPPPPPSSSPGTARRTQPPPASAFRNMMGRGSPDPTARSLGSPKAPAFAPTQLAQPAATPPNAAPPTASPPVAPPPSAPVAPARPPKPPEPRPPEAARADAKPGHRPPLTAGLDLDLQALELAAEQTNAPVYQQVRDLPPPPAAVFKGALPESTGYRAVTGPQKAPPPPVPQQPVRKPVVVEERKLTPSASRYAPSRPASIFGNAKPQEGSSIFGEDLISEKSLDEVILSYLAEDLESGPTKK